MSLAPDMWDYLKSIGFEDIPNDDARLGAYAGGWYYTIGRDNLFEDGENVSFSWGGKKYKQSPENAAILIKASNSFGELEEYIS